MLHYGFSLNLLRTLKSAASTEILLRALPQNLNSENVNRANARFNSGQSGHLKTVHFADMPFNKDTLWCMGTASCSVAKHSTWALD